VRTLPPSALFAADALQDCVVALVARYWGYARIGRHLRLSRRLVWDLWLQHCAERRQVFGLRPYRFSYQAARPLSVGALACRGEVRP
jgi:hypothetical protein